MARNVRTITVKAYNVKFAIVKNGNVEQYVAPFDTDSNRKIMKAITEAYKVDATSVMIIEKTASETTYKINDIVEAMRTLEAQGIAEVVKPNEIEA